MQFDRYDPRKTLSRTVQDTFEGGPANEAMFRGGIIQMTYGDLATRLVDAEIFDADLDVICKHLGIPREEWGSASAEIAVAIRDDAEVIMGDLALSLVAEEYREAEELHSESHHALIKLIANWQTNEDPAQHTEELKLKKEQANTLRHKVWADEDEDEEDRALLRELAKADADYHLAGMHTRAIRGGTCVPLATFVTNVIALDQETGVFGGTASRGIKYLLDEILNRTGDPEKATAPDIQVSDVFIGTVEITAFNHFIQGSIIGKARGAKALAEERLRPVFYPPSYETLQLFQPSTPMHAE